MAKAKENKGEALTVKTLKNLPSLKGWKDKALQAVQDNPFIKITDTATASQARKNRTALVGSRVELQHQRTLINKKLSEVKSQVSAETDELIELMKPHEERQQAEIDSYDEIKAEIKAEKERLETERVEGIKAKIESVEKAITDSIFVLTLEKEKEVWEIISRLKENGKLENGEDFDFMEFEILYDDMIERTDKIYIDRIEVLKIAEQERLEILDKDQKAKIDSIYRACTEVILDSDNFEELKKKSEAILIENYDYGDNLDLFIITRKAILQQLEKASDRIEKAEKFAEIEERNRQINNLIDTKSNILDIISNMTVVTRGEDEDTIAELIGTLASNIQPSLMTLILPEVDIAKGVIERSLTSKQGVLNREAKELEKKALKETNRIEARTKERRAELRVLDLITKGDGFTGFDIEILEKQIQNSTILEWEILISQTKELIKTFKSNDRKEKARQKKLKGFKDGLLKKVKKVADSYLVDQPSEKTTNEQLALDNEILAELLNWKMFVDSKIDNF